MILDYNWRRTERIEHDLSKVPAQKKLEIVRVRRKIEDRQRQFKEKKQELYLS